jgi:hypothetical protein
MALAAIYNVPSNQIEFLEWCQAHAQHHRDIDRYLFVNNQVTVPQYVFDPLAPDDMESFIYQHQSVHDLESATLGLETYDLTDVDVSNPGEFAGWIYLNADLHRQMADQTGVF